LFRIRAWRATRIDLRNCLLGHHAVHSKCCYEGVLLGRIAAAEARVIESDYAPTAARGAQCLVLDRVRAPSPDAQLDGARGRRR
jgi:hypothetical protein